MSDLRDNWRKAAVDRWYDSQDHCGQADGDPEPYVEAAADAAVDEALEPLRDAARLVVDAEYRREQWGSDTVATFDRAIQALRESLR